jgi:hypothetical protein
VQAWLDSLLLPDTEAHEWAETLVDAIAQARAEVIDTRQRLGMKHIKVRELARADAKIAALERRTRRCLNPPTPSTRPSRPAPAITKAAKQASIAARLAKGKREAGTQGPKRADAGSKRPCTKQKADKRKQSDDTDEDTDTPVKKACHKHKADKRKAAPDSEIDMSSDSDTDIDPAAKRVCRRSKGQKRKRTGVRGAAKGCKQSNTKTTADKRKRTGVRGAAKGCKQSNTKVTGDERGSQQGASLPSARQLRADIRAQHKDCISDLEPD